MHVAGNPFQNLMASSVNKQNTVAHSNVKPTSSLPSNKPPSDSQRLKAAIFSENQGGRTLGIG